MSDALVEIDGLSKSYGRVRALDQLSLRLEHGAIGLLGPNGAGKTTLLKLLLGLLAPDSGSARIAGFDPSNSSQRLRLRRAVGFMPEGDCLVAGATGIDTVATLGRLSGLTRADAMTRAHEVLDYVGIDEARYREGDGWSTGMKQRLKLAQALVHDPPLLLLDEPTNGLDPRGRRHMLELVRDLGSAQGKSLLVCSHLLPDVEFTCRSVVVLAAGRTAAQGPIENFVHARGSRARVRTRGPALELAAELARIGLVATNVLEEQFDVVLDSDDADPVLSAASRIGARITRIEPLRSTLEDAFLTALGEVRA